MSVYGNPGELSTVVSAWAHGWAVSRRTPAPVAAHGGWRIDVGLRGHRRRYVLPDPGRATLTRLGARHNSPGTWIKIAGDPGRLSAALPPEWKVSAADHLMTTTYRTAGDTAPPPAYTTRLEAAGNVITAALLDAEGEVAASGKLATTGPFGIIDQVETSPAHRRRGLGSLVMRTLAAHALRLGAHTGVLVATDDGRHLYRSLGWTVETPIAAAHVPEP